MPPCPLTPEETATYRTRLTEAENAYHSVRIGGAVREFRDQNGEAIVYSAANPLALLSYINWLRSMLGMCPMPGLVTRPAGMIL